LREKQTHTKRYYLFLLEDRNKYGKKNGKYTHVFKMFRLFLLGVQGGLGGGKLENWKYVFYFLFLWRL
jgi:hypothetical protein